MEISANVYKAARESESLEDFEKRMSKLEAEDLPEDISDENFKKEVEIRLMDLSTTNDEILELAEYATKSPELSMFFQAAMNARTQVVEALSNVMKSMQDAMRTIIANLRP